MPVSLSNSVDSTSFNGDVTERTQEQGMSWDDATWILTSSFIIFTMQSGACSRCAIVICNSKLPMYRTDYEINVLL